MPIEIIVEHSPALTQAERLLLKSVDLFVGECAFSVLTKARTRWTPWEDASRTLYVLAPWNATNEILAFYSEDEIRTLTEYTFKNDLAFNHRTQVPEGFGQRPEPA